MILSTPIRLPRIDTPSFRFAKVSEEDKKKLAAKLQRASLTAEERKLAIAARASLATFFREGWHVLEPTTPLVWNWHMDAICDHVQAMLEDWMAVQRARMKGLPEPEQRFKSFVVNIPPGTAKSRIVSVYTTAWMWLHWPSWRAIFTSGSENLVLRDSMYCRELIESSWYQSWFEPKWSMAADQNAKGFYKNTAGGFRLAATCGGKLTGDRADAFFVDDPNDAKEVLSDALRQSVNDWWDLKAGNRVNDMMSSLRIGIMQRLHERDWTGHVLPKLPDLYHMVLPMEYEISTSCKCPSCQEGRSPLGFRDPRTTPGELLMPDRFPKSVLESERLRLGTAGYAGQMQQRPAPAEGTILKARWWRFWVPKGFRTEPYPLRLDNGDIVYCPVIELPPWFDETIQSWDMAFKGAVTSDYVCGQVWARLAADAFLLDQVHDKLDFTATEAALLALSAKWPQATSKLVEDKANGPAIIASLKSRIPGLTPVEPDGDKIARAHAVTPVIESGNTYLPHPDIFPWVHGFIGESSAFPAGAYDDQVDTATQALRRLLVKEGGNTREALQEAQRVTAQLPRSPYGTSKVW
ncbi:MAG TPA: phage terminase large subunit [Bryobacteraceae bacterium]|nr:phage terminase large subunit [Bryobacteraceae bacterium]